jgi:transcriptional regulator with XRE-family HTH domain
LAKRINPTLDEGPEETWEETMANIRGHLRNAGDWNHLAKDANLAKATIANIAYGYTRSPHARTLMSLMVALGRGDEFKAAIASDEPLSKKEAIQSRPPAVRRHYAKLAKRAKLRAEAASVINKK